MWQKVFRNIIKRLVDAGNYFAFVHYAVIIVFHVYLYSAFDVSNNEYNNVDYNNVEYNKTENTYVQPVQPVCDLSADLP